MTNQEDRAFPVCFKCYKYPLIELSFEKPGNVDINCSCGNKELIPIKDYLIKIKENTNEINIISVCKEHDNFPYQFFCLSCVTHLCPECQKKHNKLHEIISLEKLNYELIKDQLTKAHEHVEQYFVTLKDEYINELKQAIDNIEKAYKKADETNREILSMVDLIMKSYNPKYPNYYVETNIISNTRFDILPFGNQTSKEKTIDTGKKNLDKLLKYFNSFSILTDFHLVEGKRFTEVNTLMEDESINSLIPLQDRRYAAVCGHNILIYTLSPFEKVMTIEGHTDTINYVDQLDNGNLISCGFDLTIRVWSITKDSYKLLHTIENTHKKMIWKVIGLSNNRIASCSFDTTVKIWKSEEPYDLIAELTGHKSDVTCIYELSGKELLLSVSFDNTMRVWNLSSYECEHVIKGVKSRWANSLIELEDNIIISGGYNMLEVVDLNTYKVTQSLKDSNLDGLYSLVQLRDENVYCGCNGKIIKYDIDSNKINVIVKKAHTSGITTMIKLNDYMFVSTSIDRSIKIWNY